MIRSFSGVVQRAGAQVVAVPAVARDGAVWAASDSTADPDEVLRAWQRWGRDCVAHLPGDFSLAVWDGTTLFCARDHFGARPFFYAHTPSAFVFANSLEAVLAHPEADAETLDDLAVADYLAGGVYNEAEATIFASVRRLPPAHAMTVRDGERALHRYWTLETRAIEVQRDAPERLESALRVSISDRVRGSSAVVFMSGGLDSPALASLAREGGLDLVAATSVYRTRIADVEERFAAEAARSIGIPHRTFVLDDYGPLHSLEAGLWTADPGALLTLSVSRDIHAAAAEHAPVAIHGHPADAVLAFEPMRYLQSLKHRPFARAAALVRYTAIKRRPPYFFFRRPRPVVPHPPPDWLRVPLRPSPHDDAPLAIRALRAAMWSSYCEWAHPIVTHAPIELVYPWGDPRVIEAALALQPIPWLVDKHVLRELLRGRVSETIRRRPKTFLQGDPTRGARPVRTLEIEAAERYIDAARFRALADPEPRVFAFEQWLRQLPNRVSELRRTGAGRA